MSALGQNLGARVGVEQAQRRGAAQRLVARLQPVDRRAGVLEHLGSAHQAARQPQQLGWLGGAQARGATEEAFGIQRAH